jgi:hypothetical protein
VSPMMSAASITSGSPMWDVVVQDTHVLARMFAVAMDGCMKNGIDDWICSPFIVLDGPSRSHLHLQFLFYSVSIRRCGNMLTS